jgi:hypothetical protein
VFVVQKNIYFVLSELIEDFVPSLSLDPSEDYYIAQLVVAETPGQAKYLAWKNDKSFVPNDLREIPKFRCNLKYKNVDMPIGIIEDTEQYPDEWWD